VRIGAIIALVAAALMWISGAGVGAAPSFQLVFDGRHNAQLQHEGTFTTTASWCSSGSVAEISVDSTTDTATRRFTCAGGGDFTATVRPLPAEHGGSGTWQIVDGTGPLSDLRGKGTFQSALVSGHPEDPATIVFRSTWNGVADFDIEPPKVTLNAATVRKLKRPVGTYSVRLALSFADNGGGLVSYVLQIVDPKKPTRAFVFKLGQAARDVTPIFRIKVPTTMRAVQLKIDSTDPVGNTAAFSRSIRLNAVSP
jgi:hypothetical protein